VIEVDVIPLEVRHPPPARDRDRPVRRDLAGDHAARERMRVELGHAGFGF